MLEEIKTEQMIQVRFLALFGLAWLCLALLGFALLGRALLGLALFSLTWLCFALLRSCFGIALLVHREN